MELISLKRTVLSEEVAENLRKLIIEDKLKPGSKLPNEIELSKTMGVSRSTLREAIKVLASKNILEVIRGKGTYISQQPGLIKDPLGVHFIQDKNIILSLFEARIIIEPGVAALAAERASKTDLKRIKNCNLNMRNAIRNKEPYHIEDLEFHIAIAEATRNPIIHRIVPIINDAIVQGYMETVHLPGAAERAVEHHHQIYEAIYQKHPDFAREMMKNHLEEAANDIKTKLLNV